MKDKNKMQYAERIQNATVLIKSMIAKNKGTFITYYGVLDILQTNYGLGESFLKKQIIKYQDMGLCELKEEDNLIKCI